MSTGIVLGNQNSNSTRTNHSDLGPFAFRVLVKPLPCDPFGHILGFLGPKDLANCEKVCSQWAQFIDLTDQWKKQCRVQLGISPKADPKRYLPNCATYKKSLEFMLSRILDEGFYKYYLGVDIGPIPRIPEEISLKKWNDPDPCAPTKKIGEEYIWMYCPSYVETMDHEDFYLNKPDEPKNPEAPELIQKEAGLVSKFVRKIGLGAQSEKKPLRIPFTINNIRTLFKNPKNGTPSNYYISPEVSQQHGNARIPAGWICMRREVIGRGQQAFRPAPGLTFPHQQALANQKRVMIPHLLHRILFNVQEHIRSDERARIVIPRFLFEQLYDYLEELRAGNAYPDGQNPCTYARTSTITRNQQGNDMVSLCGGGSPSRFSVTSGYLEINAAYNPDSIGVAVALPTQGQAIGP